MDFSNYENFISRVSAFSGGRYYIELIKSLIPLGSEKCFASSARDREKPTIFIVANDKRIINGAINWGDEANVEISFNAYQRKDIASVSVSLSNPSSIYLNHLTRLKTMNVSIGFCNGDKLTLNNKDYSPEESSFYEAIQFLIK